MRFTLRGDGEQGKNEILSDIERWEVSEWSGRSIFICSMTRHKANNILLARNLPFDSDARKWSHPLIISLHCLWTKSKNECSVWMWRDLIYFCSCCFCSFSFLHNAWCSCCSIVCLHFQVMHIKQVHCKMSTKKAFLKKTFRDIFGRLHRKEYNKASKK